MARYFMQSWSTRTWEELTSRESVLDHTAGSQFRRRGLRKGDFLYVVTNERGRLRLIGRMRIFDVLDQRDAAAFLGQSDLWEAPDHCVAKRESAKPIHRRLIVPNRILRQIRFETKNGERAPVFRGARLDPQTLRAVRELTADSGALLDGLLADAN